MEEYKEVKFKEIPLKIGDLVQIKSELNEIYKITGISGMMFGADKAIYELTQFSTDKIKILHPKTKHTMLSEMTRVHEFVNL